MIINKKICCLFGMALLVGSIYAQSDDDLFGNDDDLFFGDDDAFVIEDPVVSSQSKSDLKHGVLYETGSVKIGGTFDLSLSTMTNFKEGDEFKDSVYDTLLIPSANAQLTVDARPTENLRMYMKTGINYPYVTASNSTLAAMSLGGANILLSTDSSIKNMFYVKELFSDFNIGDNVAFRFGKQTVTWGVGYFYSPADVINVTAIDPENPTAQVEGPLCLRTQVVFPGTQNALWAYIIPDSSFNVSDSGLGLYLRDTAMAAKGEFVFGGWEIGLGGWYKYDYSPRVMATASGTLFRKLGVFGEAVVAFGQDEQWKNDEDKTVFGQGTVGFMYSWKDPQITLMGQYYYNGAEDNASLASMSSLLKRHGNNAALAVNFGKVFVNQLTANIFAMSNFDAKTIVGSASLVYRPINELSISAGPYLVCNDWTEAPIVSAKLVFTLGGGKF